MRLLSDGYLYQLAMYAPYDGGKEGLVFLWLRIFLQNFTFERLLKLICGYLQAGILADGLATIPKTGTPPGSPLTPPTKKKW